MTGNFEVNNKSDVTSKTVCSDQMVLYAAARKGREESHNTNLKKELEGDKLDYNTNDLSLMVSKKYRYQNFLNIIKDVVNFRHMSDHKASSTHIMGTPEIMENFMPKSCKELSLKYSVLEDQFDTQKIHSIYELEYTDSLDILFIKLPYPVADVNTDMTDLMDYTIKHEIPVVVILYPIHMETTLVTHHYSHIH